MGIRFVYVDGIDARAILPATLDNAHVSSLIPTHTYTVYPYMNVALYQQLSKLWLESIIMTILL